MSLRNVDYTDRELLLLIHHASANDGATSDEIAEALGYTNNGTIRATRVSGRLSWMRRYGFLDKFEQSNGEAVWVITEMGRQIMGGKLPPSVQSRLLSMDAGERVLAMRAVSSGAFQGRREVADAVRREYLHQAAKR
jgi:hypothetical protein